MHSEYLESQYSPYLAQGELQASCEICNMTNPEIECIISHLLSELKLMKIDEGSQNTFDSGGFIKLIKLIFHSKCKNFRDTMKCNHSQSEQYFIETLGTDPAYLNRLCNKKLNNIAKYNFHLDVVSHQVKTFHRHFVANSVPEPKKHTTKSNKKEVKYSSPPQGQTEDTAKKIEKQKQESTKKSNLKQENEPPSVISHLPQEFTIPQSSNYYFPYLAPNSQLPEYNLYGGMMPHFSYSFPYLGNHNMPDKQR